MHFNLRMIDITVWGRGPFTYFLPEVRYKVFMFRRWNAPSSHGLYLLALSPDAFAHGWLFTCYIFSVRSCIVLLFLSYCLLNSLSSFLQLGQSSRIRLNVTMVNQNIVKIVLHNGLLWYWSQYWSICAFKWVARSYSTWQYTHIQC